MQPTRLVVLASGMGSRLRSEASPKPLVELDDLVAAVAGVRRVARDGRAAHVGDRRRPSVGEPGREAAALGSGSAHRAVEGVGREFVRKTGSGRTGTENPCKHACRAVAGVPLEGRALGEVGRPGVRGARGHWRVAPRSPVRGAAFARAARPCRHPACRARRGRGPVASALLAWAACRSPAAGNIRVG